MKQIKAFMRRELLGRTINQLQESGARDITVTHVDAVGSLSDPTALRHNGFP